MAWCRVVIEFRLQTNLIYDRSTKIIAEMDTHCIRAFAFMELGVGLSLFFFPKSVGDNVDLNAKGADFLIYIWASRQFAFGFIFAFATYKKSIPMLTIAYLFFLVMFVDDFFIGILQKENSLIISALVMCLISSALIFAINNILNLSFTAPLPFSHIVKILE
jgi:hypothetical protein